MAEATSPLATPGAQRAPSSVGDFLFALLARAAAFITLLLLGGIIVSLIVSAMPSIEKFGFAFLWTKEWDPPAEQSARSSPSTARSSRR